MKSNLILFVLLLSGISGCGGKEDIGGIYHGRLMIEDARGVSNYRVEADVSGGLTKFSFFIKDRDTQKTISQVQVKAFPVQKVLSVRSNIFLNRPEIRVAGRETCAGASNTSPYEAELCIVNGVITLSYRENARSLYLQAYSASVNEDQQLKPGPYTLSELVEIAKEQNLNVLLKAQDLYRAREEVLLRRGNLFPNFNLGTILAAAESPFGLLSQIGNLMPFLFPDNWYRLDASKELQKAEEFSYKSLKANQVNIVAGVSLMILKDMALKQSIQAHMADLNDVLERVLLLIKAGQAPSSWEPIVRMRLIEDQEDLVSYEQYMSEQTVGLQKLLGTKPTKPGITVVPVQLPSIDASLIKDLSPEEAESISKSVEIKSTIYMEKAAGLLTKAVMWSWLNPNTDPRFNLGLGLEHAVKIQKSQIEDIKLKRTETDHTIRGNIIDIERGIKFLVDQYDLASKGEEAARIGLKNALKQFEVGQLGLLDTIEFVEQLFKYQTKKLAAQFTYLILSDKLNRHTLSGYYANLPVPKPPKPEEVN